MLCRHSPPQHGWQRPPSCVQVHLLGHWVVVSGSIKPLRRVRGPMASRAVKAYLFLYNVVQFAGWAVCLWHVSEHLLATRSFSGAYTAAGATVSNFQLLSALEILHAALGLVGGSPLTALMQWAGRSNVLFGVVAPLPEIRNQPAVGYMFLAWALSEVIRYPWYAASLSGACPHWLTWLRYTAFIVLYPIGVVGEMKSVYDALPLIKQRRLRSFSLPNPLNFAFDYHLFLVVLLCVYPLLWFQLYSFLFKQRRKKLQPAAHPKKLV